MGVPFDPESEIGRLVIGKVEFSTTTFARPQTFQVVIPSEVAKPEPSVPLSAIRALVQQFIAAAERYRIHSELSFDAPIEITVDMLKARDALLAAMRPREDR